MGLRDTLNLTVKTKPETAVGCTMPWYPFGTLLMGSQERTLNLEPESQALVSCLKWELGTELRSFGRAEDLLLTAESSV